MLHISQWLRSIEMDSSRPSKRKAVEFMTHEAKKKVIKSDSDLNADDTIDPKDAPTGSNLACASNYLVDVDGYEVRAGIALTLRSIFSKYGDIARDCSYTMPGIRRAFLEGICDVVEKLRSTECGITFTQLREMKSVVSEAAKAGLNVHWLRGFLERIEREGTQDPPDYTELIASLKQLVKAAEKDVEYTKNNLVQAEERLKRLKCTNVHELVSVELQ